MKRTLCLLPLFFAVWSAASFARADGKRPAATPPPPLLGPATLSIADASEREGTNSVDREMRFPVTLSRALPYDVSASFQTKPITAIPFEDYRSQTAGRIVIKAGQTRADIIIKIASSYFEEADKTFLVQLGAPKRVAIADSDGIGTIIDDDYAGKISVSDTSVSELNSGLKVARVQVSLSQACLHDISVDYRSDKGSATELSDFEPVRGTLLFKPSRTVLSVSVPIRGDIIGEADEILGVIISSFDPWVIKKRGSISILNDDGAIKARVRPRGKIAFVSDRDGKEQIYVMNADGVNQTRLVTGGASINPAFSRDGQKIVFAQLDDTSAFQIYTMNADGSDQKRLTSSNFNSHPAFSPDGTQIVFQSSLDDASQSPAFGTPQIVLMNADGTDQKRLTSPSETNLQPEFSPDGTQIIYNFLQQNPEPSVSKLAAYVMNLDGTNPTELTPASDSSEFGPTFSPDGGRIAFGSYFADGAGQFNLDLTIADKTGQNRQRVTFDAPQDFNASFSPDGQKLAFDTLPPRSSFRQIVVVDADGTYRTQITSLGGNFDPSWAPGSVPTPPAAAPSPAAPNPAAASANRS